MRCRCGHSEALHLHIMAGRCGVLDCNCLYFDEVTRKVDKAAVDTASEEKKCSHCHRPTEDRCARCAKRVCVIHAWTVAFGEKPGPRCFGCRGVT